MNKNLLKIALSIFTSLAIAATVCLGFTACKKDNKNGTTKSSAEVSASMEARLEQDDNYVEDPFGEEEDDADSAASGSASSDKSGSSSTTKKGSSGSSGSSATTKKSSSGSSQTTTKKSSSQTTTKKSGSSQSTSAPTNGEGEVITDENGDQWTGWY